MKKFSDAFTLSPEVISERLLLLPDRINHTLNDIVGSIPNNKPTNYDGNLPQNVETLSNHDIAMFMGMNNDWSSYLRGRLADIESEISITKEMETAVKSSLLRVMDKTLIPSDVRHLNVVEQRLYLESLSKKVSFHLKKAENNYKVLSRIISLRQNEDEKQKRFNNVSNGNGYAGFRNN